MSASTLSGAHRPGTNGSVFAHTDGLAWRRTKSRIATGVIWGSFLLALIPLVWLLWTVVSHGLKTVLSEGWFTTDQSGVTNRHSGGGVAHAIIGTFEQVTVCSVIAIPISILVAVYLVEYGNSRPAKAASFMVDILTGIPSIVRHSSYGLRPTFGGKQQGLRLVCLGNADDSRCCALDGRDARSSRTNFVKRHTH